MSSRPLADQPVAVGRIERRLGELWEQLGGDGPDSEVLRACAGNLVVVCTQPDQAADAAEAVAELVAAHPCRALLLEYLDGDEELEAFLSLHCAAGGDRGRGVCCEQVTLRAGRAAHDRLAYAALPLLVPDLPVALWAMDVGPGGWGQRVDQLGELLAQVGRVIVDTRLSDDPAGAWSMCHRPAGRRTLHCAVSDLAWARLEPWRESVAQLFDGPESAGHLDKVRRVVLEWAAAAGGRPGAGLPAALLTAGWLADRLGWKLTDVRGGDGATRELRLADRTGGPVEVVCRPGQAAAARLSSPKPDPREVGNLTQVHIETGQPEDAGFRGGTVPLVASNEGDSPLFRNGPKKGTVPCEGSFSVGRTGLADQLNLAIEPGGQPGWAPIQLTVSLRAPSTGQLLLAELEADPEDVSFQGALTVALPAALG